MFNDLALFEPGCDLYGAVTRADGSNSPIEALTVETRYNPDIPRAVSLLRRAILILRGLT